MKKIWGLRFMTVKLKFVVFENILAVFTNDLFLLNSLVGSTVRK